MNTNGSDSANPVKCPTHDSDEPDVPLQDEIEHPLKADVHSARQRRGRAH
jgi:hypothetical protein